MLNNAYRIFKNGRVTDCETHKGQNMPDKACRICKKMAGWATANPTKCKTMLKRCKNSLRAFFLTCAIMFLHFVGFAISHLCVFFHIREEFLSMFLYFWSVCNRPRVVWVFWKAMGGPVSYEWTWLHFEAVLKGHRSLLKGPRGSFKRTPGSF